MSRLNLTEAQARILRDKNEKALAALGEWRSALTLVGVDPDEVLASQLGEDPHLVLKDVAIQD